MSKNTGTSELINYFDLGVNGDVGIAGSLDINTIANATTDTDTFLVSDTGIIKYRTGAQLLSDIGAQAAGNYVTTDTSQAITANKSFTVGFSLASEGSGNQTSFFRNTSSIFSGSGGSNIFGFNNSNNIYFGKGLNNGGVLQWNNTTATRYYTLPDADGTIALTSNIPANAVGGTGTTNTLSKFTASTTIGNSSITDDGTIVSILNSSFTDVLRVGSTTRFLYFYPDSGSVNIMTGAGFTGSGITFAGFSNYLDFNTNSETRMRLTTAGNLVLGPNPFTDSGARLQVSGTATISGATSLISSTPVFNLTSTSASGYSEVYFYRNTNSLTAYISSGVNENVTASGDAFVFDNRISGGNMVFRTNGGSGATERLRIASTGAATFSSSVTATGLIINNNGEALRAYGLSPNVSFYNSANTVRGGYVNHDGSNMNIVANVGGISLTGAATFSSSVTATNLSINTNTTDGRIDVRPNGISTFPIFWRNNNGGYGGGIYVTGGNNMQLYLANSSGTENVLISSLGTSHFNGGNVLIGTTTDNGSRLTVTDASTYTFSVGAASGGAGAVLGVFGSAALTFATNGLSNERMRITSGGRVGIQNTAPQGILEVGKVDANNTYGGHFFSTFFIPVNTWYTVFYAPNDNWAAITEFTWTSAADYNRSGAAYMRWAYNGGANALGVVWTLFNDSQNSTATFRNSGGEIQINISGGAANYYVQVRIQGSKAA